MMATLVMEILANHASFLPKPQIPLEPEKLNLRRPIIVQWTCFFKTMLPKGAIPVFFKPQMSLFWRTMLIVNKL